MRPDVLSHRALNRATLERQLLLRHSSISVRDAVTHLLGMQAQEPLDPYIGLWSRLEDFDPESLVHLLVEREVVRIVVMRGTIHLVTADDCLVLRPLVQPVLDRELTNHSQYKDAIAATDLGPVLAFLRPLLAERPHSGRELRAVITERFPGLDAAAMAYACRNLLAFVQVPPRGIWGRTAQVRSTTAESFLDRPLAANPSIDTVVLRYFGTFGPATAGDVSRWSGLTGMREVVDRLQPRLRRFADERGRELFDLPDAPRPDDDVPAPPRFFPEYDNVFLGYADRSRFNRDGTHAARSANQTPARGAVTCDGFWCGVWRLDDDRRADRTILTVDHVGRLTKKATSSVAAEGRRLLRLVAPHSNTREVRFSPAMQP